jgi:hypothetical protein
MRENERNENYILFKKNIYYSKKIYIIQKKYILFKKNIYYYIISIIII